MIETIFSFIQNKEQELINSNKFPTHVLDVDIYTNFGRKESQKVLKQLTDSNRITWGRTINNLFFKTKPEQK